MFGKGVCWADPTSKKPMNWWFIYRYIYIYVFIYTRIPYTSIWKKKVGTENKKQKKTSFNLHSPKRFHRFAMLRAFPENDYLLILSFWYRGGDFFIFREGELREPSVASCPRCYWKTFKVCPSEDLENGVFFFWCWRSRGEEPRYFPNEYLYICIYRYLYAAKTLALEIYMHMLPYQKLLFEKK